MIFTNYSVNSMLYTNPVYPISSNMKKAHDNNNEKHKKNQEKNFKDYLKTENAKYTNES